MSGEIIGKNDPFRKNSKRGVAKTTNLEQAGAPFDKEKRTGSKGSPTYQSSNNVV